MRFTTSDRVSLHYTDEGAGKPVICLSGLTRNSRDFSYMTPHFPDLRLIKMDYRGRGQSDWADPETYTIPREAQDVVELMDHLGLDRAAILGTSRGGLVALGLGAMVRDRLTGVAFNDIGPAVDPAGVEVIKTYIGRNPVWKTHDEAAAARAKVMSGFTGVSESRWREEVEKLYVETDEGLQITYDPRLRDAVLATGAQPEPDLWPFFDALDGLPLACIRGATSDILSRATYDEMCRRRPDMIAVELPDRGHIPFLDEPAAVVALRRWSDLLP